jgi:DNA repair protein SbcD/Mre11
MLHPEIPGLFPEGVTDYGGARVDVSELGGAGQGAFDYVALGHYHIVHEVAPRIWYSGSLEYTSSNVWGEQRQEKDGKLGIEQIDWGERPGERPPGLTKGFLVADLDRGEVTRVNLPPRRKVWDLQWLNAAEMTAEDLDAQIRSRVGELPFPIAGAVVRLVVRNVPRALAQALDHDALRAYRAGALHFHLDLRRPEPDRRKVGTGGPGAHQSLPDRVAEYLRRRPLDADLERDDMIALGRAYLDEVERALLEGEA